MVLYIFEYFDILYFFLLNYGYVKDVRAKKNVWQI